MELLNKTILIIGGSRGMGYEFAKLFASKGNNVIVTARNENNLVKAVKGFPNMSYIVADTDDETDIDNVFQHILARYNKLDILINSAGRGNVYNIAIEMNPYGKARGEIMTNYLSVVRNTANFLPLLTGHSESAIVNVSSVVAFVPSSSLPTYSASKAALHSYTQTLRYALDKRTQIKVFELMPPLVNTEFAKDIGGQKGLSPTLVAEALVTAMEEDKLEIHVGGTEAIYEQYLNSPSVAFDKRNP